RGVQMLIASQITQADHDKDEYRRSGVRERRLFRAGSDARAPRRLFARHHEHRCLRLLSWHRITIQDVFRPRLWGAAAKSNCLGDSKASNRRSTTRSSQSFEATVKVGWLTTRRRTWPRRSDCRPTAARWPRETEVVRDARASISDRGTIKHSVSPVAARSLSLES